MPEQKFARRLAVAHKAENQYAGTAKKCDPLTRNVHEFLDYCRLRAEVAREAELIFHAHDDSMLIGYLTGSVGPLITTRLLLEPTHPDCIRYVGSIKEWAPTGKTPKEHYEATLDDLSRSGKRHFILADEFVGGGSVDRLLKLTWDWLQGATTVTGATFSVVAFAGNSSKPDAVFFDRVNKYRNLGMPICSARIYRCCVLLEMDKPGKAFNPIVKKDGKPGEYEFKKVQAAFLLKCPNGGPCGGGGSVSIDQIFGDSVERVIGSKLPHSVSPGTLVWPESIREGNCNECSRLLSIARRTWVTRY